jgi:hypothetical protein
VRRWRRNPTKLIQIKQIDDMDKKQVTTDSSEFKGRGLEAQTDESEIV